VAEKDTNAALTFVRNEIQHRPQDADLYHELAQVYLLQNKRAEAVAALKQALSLAPASADTALLLAEVYAGGKETEQAMQLVSQLMQKYPQTPDVIFRAGMIFESVQRWDDARKAYEHVVQLDQDNTLAKNNLAWLLAEHGGNIDVALNLAQDAKQKSVNNLQITNTIGWIYYKKGVYKMALNYLKECAEKDSKNASFQYQLGMVYWKLGDKEEARRLLVIALRLNPNFPESQSAHDILDQLL
jgi:tetratricopeptide (TPR) repeat protein